MKLRARRVGSALLLDLEGRLTVDADRRRLHELVASTVRLDGSDVVLNLAEVSRLDCSGVGQLVELYQEVRRSGGALKLVKVERRQQRLLEVVKLLSVFELFDSETEALASCRELSRTAAAGFREPASGGRRVGPRQLRRDVVPSLV